MLSIHTTLYCHIHLTSLHLILHLDGRSVRQKAESKQILDAGTRFEYAHFCASELYLAVADGLTMRTLKVAECLKTSVKCNADVSFSL
jgi:hypothetical protein